GKMTRNFGERVPARAAQKNRSRHCLAKTPVYAKPKVEVYGLTLPCWKVRGGG
ncbi:hypothetical protein RUMOBE_04215, partial [Blautia obeum ATCC 29174]